MVNTLGSVPIGSVGCGLDVCDPDAVMSWTVLVVTVLFAVPALVLGSTKLYLPMRWDQRRRRLPLRDVLDRMVVMGVRLLIVLTLTLLALVAAVGSIAALHGDVALPDGVVIAGIGAILLSILTLATFGRPRR